MEEQTPNIETTPEVETPSEEAPASGGAPSGLSDLSQKVTLGDGREVSLQDLVGAWGEVEGLREYKKHARTLMQGDGEWTEERELATRAVMSDAGYSPEMIEAWVEQVQQGGEEPEGEDMTTVTGSQPTPEGEETGGGEDPRDQQIRELQARLEQIEQRTTQNRTDDLKLRLDQAVSGALDESEAVRTLLTAAERLNGPDEDGRRKSQIAAQLREQTLERLRQRKARGGHFSPEWFQEEALKAADVVADAYRSVIGDPAKLGRAPETVTGEDMFRSLKPVEEPKPDRNADQATRRQMALDYTEGTLMEIAAKASQGGEGRV